MENIHINSKRGKKNEGSVNGKKQYALRESSMGRQREDNKSNDTNEQSITSSSSSTNNDSHINGYYEVEEILDRRVAHKGNGDFVEYLITWKNDSSDPSWMIAENLDQNSLAEAFHRFPTSGDPAVIDGDDDDDESSEVD
eukprot:13672453-Ditylum_brightwellii.AAC.1